MVSEMMFKTIALDQLCGAADEPFSNDAEKGAPLQWNL
jgi:hypothetical protein